MARPNRPTLERERARLETRLKTMSQTEKEALESQTNEVRRINALVVRAFAEALKSSLGPQGLDKMLIGPHKNVTITNDGSTWLRYLMNEVRHPTAKMLVDAARTMYKEVGDGTTSMIVLASELIWRARSLTEKGVAPSTIETGYSAAMNKTLKIYSDLAMRIDPMDTKKLKAVAMTAIAGKSMLTDEDQLASFAVEAVLAAAYKASSGYRVDLEDVGIEKKEGESGNETMLIKGLAIAEREVAHPSMPKLITNARIAILNRPLAIELKPKDTELAGGGGTWTLTDMKFKVDSVEKLQSSIVQKERLLEGWVEKIASSGANVVVCRRHIDNLAKFLLGRRGILAVEHVRQPEIFKLAKASGGRIVEGFDEIAASDLGSADTVQERDMGPPKPWLFIEGCKNPRSYTLVIRGGTKTVVESSERSLRNALSAVRNAVINPKILPGGGAPEAEAARRIRIWAASLPGREQLPASIFADALEEIPSALARNAGMDAINTLVRLRSRHSRGESMTGIDGFAQEIGNTAARSIYDTLTVKEQVIKSAGELALTIIRIDMILASTKPQTEKHRLSRYGMDLTKQVEGS
jgi:chaperonin GroEL (HSP60 family)